LRARLALTFLDANYNLHHKGTVGSPSLTSISGFKKGVP
jgi:hypothetical protein